MNTNPMPELSRSQRKKLKAEMFNQKRNELVRVTCPACKNRVSVDVQNATHRQHLTIVSCPECHHEMQLARWVR